MQHISHKQFNCNKIFFRPLIQKIQRVTMVTYTDITQRRRLEIHCQPG